ncbi:hypothetical protein [Williamsia muralis]|uniref:Uncharacterized protein n=1 Tax=Williamsia marianensis TaxID=85044 RepID=A0A315S929_WILMA|nr:MULTISPECIES: hypothetical protein [Williamsia]MDV7132748.1 hypothetical protein [Williamsia muralis]PVY28998.1 hypothetical protein C7458_107207 [Williamsia marianensis]RKR93985.1 hypothetical protein DFJ75_0775 [Williamsia muralis]
MTYEAVGAPRNRPELLVAIDGDDNPIAWSGPRPRDAHAGVIRRIRQPELRGGIRERTQMRAAWTSLGNEPADLVVALEIDVLIADDAATARAKLLRLGESRFGDTVRYVGTANGLLTLILDIYTAEVADAVILRPIDSAAESADDSVDAGRNTAALIAEQVLPQLTKRSVAA